MILGSCWTPRGTRCNSIQQRESLGGEERLFHGNKDRPLLSTVEGGPAPEVMDQASCNLAVKKKKDVAEFIHGRVMTMILVVLLLMN